MMSRYLLIAVDTLVDHFVRVAIMVVIVKTLKMA
jgi:hypothetical protein